MAKAKRKKNLSESKILAAKNEPKKLNAFEMHVNRRKFNITGMKLKAEKGLPGISRSRAIKKRKATLMQEFKWKDKKNTFLDRRIGERDSAMTAEDKILARFTAERVKLYEKKSIFNLGDGIDLTHRGESLTDVEKYDDPKSDDDFDEEDGKLDAEFVRDAHFGGGMLKKVDGESRSRKDIIDQLIAESKKRKIEKQKIREETIDLTHKLDAEWKELLPLVTCNKKTDDIGLEYKKDNKTASYDILTKQLKFEARGKPMDKLKSEEELAKEEKTKLEALEKERLSRMFGENQQTSVKHRSADDLDDGFYFDHGSDFVLSYGKDGLPNMSNEPADNSSLKKSGNEKDEEDEENEEDEDEGEKDGNVEDAEQASVHENEHDIDENDSTSSDGEADNLSDLKNSDESDVEIEKSILEGKLRKKILGNIFERNKKVEEGKQEPIDSEHGVEEPKKGSNKSELPYTFEIPTNYEDFETLINSANFSTQAVIIERMIKCNHPSLRDSNKDRLDTLFTYLLQYLDDSARDLSPKGNCFKVLDNISTFLYDIAMGNLESCVFTVLTVIKEKYQNFLTRCKVFPGLDTLIFIKLVSVLFSTSDYRHKVATPTLIFMEHMIMSCRITSSIDLSIGLFLSTLILEFCAFSKRVVPEVFHFLRNVLRLSHPKESSLPILLPLRSQDIEKFNLIVCNKSVSYPIGKLGIQDLNTLNNSEEFKIKAVALALQILSELCDILGDKNGAILLFKSFIPFLQPDNFSSCLQEKVHGVIDKILFISKKPLDRLVFEKKRPRPLKLYEPKIEEIYSLKKHKPMGKQKQERVKLQHRYKRELKGALREIRKDNSFLAKLKFKEIQKSDMERQRKVREILGAVAQQTGEVRKLKKKA